jgi:hypothetical protein
MSEQTRATWLKPRVGTEELGIRDSRLERFCYFRASVADPPLSANASFVVRRAKIFAGDRKLLV